MAVVNGNREKGDIEAADRNVEDDGDHRYGHNPVTTVYVTPKQFASDKSLPKYLLRKQAIERVLHSVSYKDKYWHTTLQSD
jgi:hypothetical protein